MTVFQVQRYAPGSYGGMCQSDTGRYVELTEVKEMLAEELGCEKAREMEAKYLTNHEEEQ